MDRDLATQRLIEAELTLQRALTRLHTEQRDSILGRGDPEELDNAILEHRQARVDAQAAHAAWRNTHPDAAEVDAPLPVPETVSPRLLFARWLFETGRITEWQAA